MKKTWKVGVWAGLISGVAGIALFYLLTVLTGLHFSQLNPVSIMVVSIVVNCVGASVYAKLRNKISRPRLTYALIAVGVALLLSWMDWAYPPEPQIGDIANPIHAIVVGLSIILIPIGLRKGRSVR